MADIWDNLAKALIILNPLLLFSLLLCSVLALAIFILKVYQLRRRKVIIPDIVNLIHSIKKPEDIDLAISICKKNEGPFANVICTGLANRDLPREELKEIIIDQGRQETRVLERGLVTLETIAGIAPLLGLLGTVLGMIDVFDVISNSKVVLAEKLSGGISKALLTTVAGLTIGIPSLAAYNYLVSKAETLILEIEKFSSALMKRLRSLSDKSYQ
ncbi:MotA/TolQ/ExbB proton channel family protein [candidate division KSB1 bacterium]|nr:MotA/TolQ/ExbB proton channel family protein [candidate division KSB1 bacterium]